MLKEPHEVEVNEMTNITKDIGIMPNGQINPALKFSKEDLLSPGADNITDDGSSVSDDAKPEALREYGGGDR